MVLLSSLLSLSDIFTGPLVFVILLMCFSVVAKKYKNEEQKRLLFRAFYFKMFCALAYGLLNSYYYKSGDTEMYYFCTQRLRTAVMDDTDNFTKIFMTKAVNVKTTLMNYFIYTDSPYPEFEAMHDPGNFMVPKLAMPFALLFNNSYLAIAMFFSFFALGGAIRLYKVFYHYYPQYWRELALAILFLPSVGYWSSGLLKDSVTFGAVGYIVHAMFSIFVRRKKFITSIIWILIAGGLCYFIKVYILLAISPAIVLWLFAEFNKVVDNKVLRRIMAGITFVIGGILAYFLVNYVTSDESLKAFRLDSIAETSANSRALYEGFSTTNAGAYYNIASGNPVFLVFNGIVATLFRPFIWEINGLTAFLSALEALFFLYITLMLMMKKGFLNFFRNAFKQPVLIMCFIFSIVFAAAVGSTALNFGSLSRYKIPCLPFYLVMVLVLYRQAELTYPSWLKKILGYRPKYPYIRRAAT